MNQLVFQKSPYGKKCSSSSHDLILYIHLIYQTCSSITTNWRLNFWKRNSYIPKCILKQNPFPKILKFLWRLLQGSNVCGLYATECVQSSTANTVTDLPVGDTWRLAPLPPVIAASVTRFCMLIGFIAETNKHQHFNKLVKQSFTMATI